MRDAGGPVQLTPQVIAELQRRGKDAARRRRRIAVVGMSCRFPKAANPAAFWKLLASGGDAVTRGRPGDLAVDPETTAAAPWGAYVGGLDRFDAAFFRIAPVEAALLDPQQRLLLEVSWEALEDAGINPLGLTGTRAGVYAGISTSDYRELLDPAAHQGDGGLHLATGTSLATAIGRVAFTLGLQGPAMAVETACSSSLVAVHQAMAGLHSGEADLALAGGVNAILLGWATRVFEDAGMLAPDGRCKTFDAAADGYVRGEGCGMLVLKRLSDAERDGDRILGVLLGSAVNQDGTSAGLTVPNGPAQERVIRDALDRAGVPPAAVDYLEAHGTGTELGDPIEVRAAAAAYGQGRDADHPLLLGSVKTNVGHLESAAGVAGLIKVLLAMREGVIPKHLHIERPNPRLDWDSLPVRVTNKATPWPENPDRPLRAGVSSFGFSGTNAHLIVEGWKQEQERRQERRPSDRHRPPQADETPLAQRPHRVFPLSGKTPESLRAVARRYRDWLAESDRDWAALSDAAWTAGTGRSHFGHRAAVVFRDAAELSEGLQLVERGGGAAAAPGKTAFLFADHGSQWAGTARELYRSEPVFREVLDRCEAVFREECDEPLAAAMFGEPERPEWTQPALYALESGLAALWRSVGVRPDAVFGHGAGELAAAGAAGVFGLEAGMRFACRRGALLGSLSTDGTGAEAAALPALEEAAAELEVTEPSVPLVSGVTGQLPGPGEGWDAGYWVRQARSPVRFERAMETLAELGVRVLVEVGPPAAPAWPDAAGEAPAVVAGVTDGSDGGFARTVRSAYEAGLPVSFAGLFAGERRRRVALPTYPFQRERHWAPAPGRRRAAPPHPLLGERRELPTSEVSFEIETADLDGLEDHRVFDRVVASGALYAAQALAALRSEDGRPGAVLLEDVRIERPLVLAEEAAPGGRTLHLVLAGEEDSERAFEVFSRGGPDEPWVRHAAGRVRGGARAPSVAAAEIERLQAGGTPIDGAEVRGRLETAGIRYGPAFRRLARLWSGSGEALGELEGPEEGDPGLLDGCFQVVAGLGDPEDRDPWLPVGWERLWIEGGLPRRFWCHARQAEADGEVRRADLAFYAPDGAPIGGVEGFRLRRADLAALLAAGGVEDLLYQVEWRETETGGLRPADFLQEPAAAEVRDFEEFLAAEEVDGARLAGLTAGLDDLARSCAREALGRESGPVEEHRRLFARVRELAGGAESLGPPEALAAELGERYPEGRVELGLLRRCGAALPEVLRGRADGLELLFSGTPNAADLYRESPGYRALNALAGEAVASVVSGLPEGRRLRVLEVGAGTGGTTAALLEALPEGRTDYLFTDVSAGFLGDAEERFGGSEAGMSYRVLDIERDPGEQGFAAHRHDLVVAANVLHATRDLGESLAHCRKLLAPSGVLVLLEGVEAHGWLDLTFGMLPGWWRFEDDYRGEHPLVSPSVWRQALSASGFGETAVLGTAVGAVILARGPAEVEPASGLFVLAEGDAFGEDLAEELRRRRQTVVRGPAGKDRETWGSFLASLPPEPPLAGIAHLGGLSGGGELIDDVEGALSSALALTQGLLKTGAAPAAGVWFVTRGGQVLGGERDGLFGAALWGFGRTADRELGDLPVRMLDLQEETPVGRLAEELLFPDRETEALYRGGTRRVPRLVRLPGEAPAEAPRLRGDRSYLVTGGLGGIGLQVAGWLAERGAGAVVLNGRRAPDPAAEKQIAALRSRGVAVRLAVADVADPGAVDRMLAEIAAAELPPLAGVIHSVGVLADASLANQDWLRFERVLRPKVLGAWNLHRATLDLDLELFVLFSSLAGLVGNPGQANHGAANAFLDQLALWRRSAGLPGQVIQWGAWSGIGEAEEARRRIGDRLEAAGAGWISPRQALAALDRLVAGDVGTAAVGAMDWRAVVRNARGDRRTGGRPGPALLRELVPDRHVVPAAPTSELAARLRETLEPERETLLAEHVREQVRAVLQLPEPPPADVGFFDLGMDSLMAVEVRDRLKRDLSGVLPEDAIPNTVTFDYPNAARLARYLAGRLGDGAALARAPAPRITPHGGEERIAVVGMACRFPGGASLGEFWRTLESGGDAVTSGRPGDPLLPSDADAAPRWGAYVRGLDRFDPEFFRISPVEAELMDPQQRLLLEVSWEAFEDAGMDPGGLAGSRTGVHVGIMNNDYVRLLPPAGDDRARSLYVSTGSSFGAAIGRVAFVLGLEGPAMAVDTACSSSLTAIHQAAAGLQRGEADLALAGGVNAILISEGTDLPMTAGMLARDGRCKTFDAAADGYVRGEGCGLLVLKRLADAERDGDRIWGVLLGSAVNQDGASAGFTVPNGPAQERVIGEALARAGVEPGSVDYLEAHGTGTELGDPIEVRAAATVYGEGRDPDHPLLLGSVKTNVGHLESAAGVAGVVKVLLAMREGVIPKHLHFERPNPRLDWDSLPVRVTREATPWPKNLGRPVRAAVSSFGFSGTNAHLILEAWQQDQEQERRSSDRHRPPQADETPLAERPHRVFPLSAKTPNALRALAERYQDWLAETDPDWETLSDATWTAGTGRSHFAHRAALVFRDVTELREGLELVERNGGVAPPEEPAPPMPARQTEATDGEFARAIADAYQAGSEVFFAELFPGERRRRIALPTYPFQRERYWAPAPRRRAAPAHPLLGERRALPSGEVSFEIESAELDWLGDHRVFDRVVAPGAFYGLQALAALAAEDRRPDVRRVDGVRIERPLVLPEPKSEGPAPGSRVLHLVLAEEKNSARAFEVYSRGEKRESWVRHAAGTVRAGARAPSAAALAAAEIERLQAAGTPMEGDEVRRRLEAAGIRYGPAFRRLARLWSGSGEALGELEAPERGREGDPGLLDGCFQVLAGLGDPEDRDPWLPVEWERLWLAGHLPRRVWCRARQTEKDEEVRKADLAFHAPDGTPIGGVEGFRLRRVDRSALLAGSERVDDLLYRIEWREAGGSGLRPAAFLQEPAAVEVRDFEAFLSAEGMDGTRLAGLTAGLDDLARSYAREALGRESGPVEEQRRLFARVRELAANAGSSDSPDALAAALAERYPEGAVELGLLRRCGEALPDVLRGRAEGLELLFSGAPNAADLYRESPGYRALNALAGEAVASVVSGLPEGRRLRVLEVGAGTGGTTAALLAALPQGRTDTVFTDVSAGFFGEAEERFGGSDARMSYRVLDIERDPEEQGFAAHRHDLVVAANVLHATRDLEESLAHCRRLLAPSGILVLVEGVEPQAWLDLTFGMLPGWWRFEDGYREDHPLVGPDAWRRALSASGFGEAAVFGTAAGAVLLARGPAEVEPASGLFVLADGDAFGDELAEQLRRRRQTVVRGPAGGDRETWRSFLASLPEEPPLRCVAHLGALSGGSDVMDDVRGALSSALALTQGLHDAGRVPEAGAWFVTRGGQVLGGERDGQLSGSALWGFGRTAARELADLPVRMLDLEPGVEAPVGRLVEELLFPDRETEILCRGEARRVPRLIRLPPVTARPDGNWRFAPDPGGDFDGLPVERVTGTPVEGEVRVAVEAAGLNFHDVLVAMGVVDPDAALGGEFCGRVLEAGPGVRGVQVGDRVLGFAAGTFGPEVVARAEVVVPAPPGFSATALATIPTAFVTAALAFEEAELEAGDVVLVHAGTGGVGQAAIQWARAAGLRVYATASVGKREYLRSLGVAGAFDSRSTAFGEEVLAATDGAGVRLVLNSLTGTGFIEAGLSCLAEGGTFVELGKRGIWSAEEMAAARPDVAYRPLAVDRLLEEDPSRLGRVLGEVVERVGRGELTPLPHRRWPLAELGSALEEMREARHVGKLVVVPSPLAGGRLRADRSYLVTGGLGGVGLRVAEWLLEQGAGGVVLNGRREPEGAQEEAVARLEAAGTPVRVAVADVADRAAVDRMLEEIGASELPPLGGVIHAAGALSDASLPNQDWASFERVLGPKALGAWNLHRATLDLDLDLFVLFSSLTGVVGNPGQANHAAANAFLDQLAGWRRSAGLPGQAIQWGAWSGVGEAEEQRGRIGERLAAAGVGWLSPEQGLAALTRLVREDAGAAAVAAVDWERLGREEGRLPALVGELVVREAPRDAAGGGIASRLAAAEAAEREALLLELVRDEVASLLRLTAPPAPDVGFFELGMDSLMAVELRNRLNRTLAGARGDAPALADTAVFDHPSPAKLARALAAPFAGAAPGERAEDTPDPEAALDRLFEEIEAEFGGSR